MKVSASFLSSKKAERDLMILNDTDVDYIHVDFMDGKFTKNTGYSVRQLKKVYKFTSKRLDVHLMVKKPKKYIRSFADLNTEYLSFHVEIGEEIEPLLDLTKAYGMKCGLAISPTTPMEKLEKYLPLLDQVVVMSVEPGKGGQAFLKETPKRIKELKEMIQEKGLNLIISVDGGITDETRKQVDLADMVVAGSYIVKSEDFQQAITSLR